MIKSKHDINELISLKNLKNSHNTSEIQYIVDSYTNDIIDESQMTYWLKSICTNGMDFNEKGRNLADIYKNTLHQN